MVSENVRLRAIVCNLNKV